MWRSRLFNLTLFALTVGAVGCGQEAGVEALLDGASARLEAGDAAGALPLLRQAAGQRPDSAEIRLVLAQAYLAVGQGDLAEVSVDQAVERGAEPSRVIPIRAEALLQQQRFFELVELALPDELPDPVRIAIKRFQADAERALYDRGLADGEVVTQTYLDLFEALQESDDVSLADTGAAIDEIRASHELAERAFEHFVCRNQNPAPTFWQPGVSAGNIIRVGPDRPVKTPAQAARIARNGSIVEIDPGTYPGGVARWRQSDLTVRGLGNRPHITADGRRVDDRDVWLFTGDRVRVENIEISGARSSLRNGAGIRHIGQDLVLSHVYLHDNENGLLTGNQRTRSETLIEYSEFADNGDGEGYAHNIYIGRSARFEMRYSYSHEVKGGHLVKSRARANRIAYNRISDNEGGTSSYAIDLPEGGDAEVIGNIIQQGYLTLNHAMISFGAEMLQDEDNRLVVASNSLFNRDAYGIGIRNPKDLSVLVINNVVAGAPLGLVVGAAQQIANPITREADLADPRGYDFSLAAGAQAIDIGSDAGPMPTAEYVHPLGWRSRQRVWKLDAGAYEHCGL